MLSSKDSYGNKASFKYFIGCINNGFSIPLCIKIPQVNGYVKYIDNKNKYVIFLADELYVPFDS